MLDLHSNQEKFGSFLRAALDVLSQLLELATLNDINKVSGWLNDCFIVLLTTKVQSLHGMIHGTCFDSVWRKSWAISSPVSPENQPWLLCVSSRSVMCEVIVGFVWQSFVSALGSVLQLVQLHTERGWFLPTGPVKSSVSLCDGSIHHIYTHLIIVSKGP